MKVKQYIKFECFQAMNQIYDNHSLGLKLGFYISQKD